MRDHAGDGSSLIEARQDYVVNESVSVLALSAVLAIFATIVVMRILTRNLGHLERAMLDFRESGFASLPAQPDASIHRGDEIQRLKLMFWELAEVLRARLLELEKSNADRREILANVSHDLRTPIATLMVHLETLTIDPNINMEERQQYLETSLRQCRALSDLVEQLLTVARLDSGQVAYAPEKFHVGELLHDVAQKFQLRAEKAGITIKPVENEELPLVVGDIGLVERALDNLLDNAIEHTESGGQIKLNANLRDGVVQIAVVDNGAGIPEDKQHLVKERFYRADESRVQVEGHAGLGLAIVSGIAALHGSDLAIESRQGVGTTASFKLPVAV